MGYAQCAVEAGAWQGEDQIVHWVRRENAEMMRRSQKMTAESEAAELARKYEFVKQQYLELATRVEVCCQVRFEPCHLPRPIATRTRAPSVGRCAEGRWWYSTYSR